jgi:lipopolysaccharide export system permease protein
VALLALGLLASNGAAKQSALVPLIWVQAVAPGLVCAWLLFGPHLFQAPAAVRAPAGLA